MTCIIKLIKIKQAGKRPAPVGNSGGVLNTSISAKVFETGQRVSVLQNISTGVRCLTGQKDGSSKEVKALCELVGLAENVNELAVNLSYGDQKLLIPIG